MSNEEERETCVSSAAGERTLTGVDASTRERGALFEPAAVPPVLGCMTPQRNSSL